MQSDFFPVNLQVQIDFLAAVEARNRARGRFGAVLLRMHFVIRIRVEPAEAVTARVIRVIAPHGICPRVF